MSDLAKYTAIFGEDFGPIIDALENGLNPNVQSQVLNILDDLTLKADIFGRQVESTVARLSRNGANANTIRSALKADMATGGSIFGSLKRDVKEGIVEQINQSGRIGMMEEYANVEKFKWVSVGGHKVCKDCAPRAGKVLTWEQWVQEGLPGSGWSVCGGHCYCILDGSGKLPKEVKVPANVQEPKSKKARLMPSKYPKKPTYTTYETTERATQEFWANYVPPAAADDSAAAAYKSYFKDGYTNINRHARGAPLTRYAAENRASLIRAQYNAMVKAYDDMPGFKGTSYRGSGQMTAEIWEQRLAPYKDNVGGIVNEKMFFSTSANKRTGYRWQNSRPNRIEFKIEGRSGIAADGQEAFDELEVLFNSNTQFEVVSVEVAQDAASMLADGRGRAYDNYALVILREI